ncbi:FluC/FEX family fluoride channel [Schleiferilactobacillus shenzhenensis]|nr:CrcB family protein [Schleiferilactobacillus shenzhenensis]
MIMDKTARRGNGVVVFIGGAAGGLARYGLNWVIGDTSGFLGTMAENLVGSFLLAWLTAYAVDSDWPDRLVLGLGTGVLGGFTTFSTLMLATVSHLGRAPLQTLGFLLVNLVGGLVLAVTGYAWGFRGTTRREGAR